MGVRCLFLIIVSSFHWSLCEVHLKVIFQPPMATLECTILHPKEVASAVLICPNDVMCFQNCLRLCNNDNCISNNISCSQSDIGSLKKFIYVFNASNPKNQGEWTCHYGSEKGSTAIFYVEGSSAHAKREIKVVPITESIKNFENKIHPSTHSKANKSSQVTSSTKLAPDSNRKSEKSILINVNPQYVIILLLVFSISLLINIIFLVRDILTSISTRNFVNQTEGKKYSYWLTMCIKLFCVEKMFKMRQPYKIDRLPTEINPLLSRQVSSNVYEYPAQFHIQPPLYLENFAYISTPSNDRAPFSNDFIRAQSFPLKANESKLYPPLISTSQLLKDNSGQCSVLENSPVNEISSQLIYDDVAEPSIHYIPFDNSLYCSSLARPNRMSRQLSGQRKHLVALSMNNINLNTKCPSDSVIVNDDSDNNVTLKDAINSRVELSKEMISQADDLLRKADDLLNRKDSSKDN